MHIIPIALSAVGSLAGAASEAGALKDSARADERNANLTLLQGELDAQETRREERLAAGAGLAAAAGNGEALGTGTIADLFEQSALYREMDIANLRYSAAGEARNLNISARDKRKAAKFALIKGAIGAGSAIAGGIAQNKSNEKLTAAAARDRQSAEGPLGRGRTGAASAPVGRTRDGLNRRRLSVFGLPGGY
jgi:F0F1-type ATP synthase membrane subunit c/vacuolar-type H+-ATPase subunit K